MHALKGMKDIVDVNTEFILNNSAEFDDFSWLHEEDDFSSDYYSGSEEEQKDFF